MTGWMWFFLAAFIVNMGLIGLLWRRKSAPLTVVLTVSMLLSLYCLIRLAVKHDEAEEAIWHPKSITWKKEQAPLRVYWSDRDFDVYEQTIRAAMDTWNTRIGCTVLVRTPDLGKYDITIRTHDGSACGDSVPEGKDTPARAHYCASYVDIQMKRLDHIGLAFRFFLHELGHALGLDHDETGAMSATVREPQEGDYPDHLLPSNKDVAALKARFCP